MVGGLGQEAGGGAPLVIRGAVKSDIGRIRGENQDAFGFFPDLALYAVADGLGGHAAGRVASSLTIDAVRRSLLETREEDLTPVVDARGRCSVSGRQLMIAVYHANERVLETSRREPGMQGMGTTLSALLYDPVYDLIAVCHVGDTRVYRIRDDAIVQLTEDHTVVQRLLKEGRIHPEEIASSPHRHLLTQAVGLEELLRPDLVLEKPLPDDVYLLCSDGLHDVVGAEEMRDAVRRLSPDLDAACAHLIELANERGGRDNSTVLIVRCERAAAAPGA